MIRGTHSRCLATMTHFLCHHTLPTPYQTTPPCLQQSILTWCSRYHVRQTCCHQPRGMCQGQMVLRREEDGGVKSEKGTHR